MKLLLISLLCLFQLQYANHKFYVSVTDIEYVAEKENLQIISRIFADDFEEVLEERYQIAMVLLPDEETEDADRWIARYVQQKLFISADGKPLSLTYLGKRYEDDRIYLYLEVENLPAFNEIAVENLILTDLFEEQKNLVHLKNNGKIKSAVLIKDKAKHTFTH